MKPMRVKDVEVGDIFLYQAPDQPLRAWIHLGQNKNPNETDYPNCIWAESYYSYAEYGDSTPRERKSVRSRPQNHHPSKYLWLRADQMVFA